VYDPSISFSAKDVFALDDVFDIAKGYQVIGVSRRHWISGGEFDLTSKRK
jgi:hypothetical protein